MNLNTIMEVKRPTSADEVGPWKEGYAWLAGGTWLFSEPQVDDRYADRSRQPGLGAADCDAGRPRDRRDLPHR